MKKFTITQQNGTKHIVNVDDEDWDQVSKYPWHVKTKDGKVTAVEAHVKRNDNPNLWTTLMLHQLLMGPVPPEYDNIDHIDRAPLNNCRANLRFVTWREQSINRGMRRDNTSGVTGVYWDKTHNRWGVSIGNKNVGYYTAFEKACEARTQAENTRDREEVHD